MPIVSALNDFVAEAQHIGSSFDSVAVFSIFGWEISQYTLYMFIALAVVLLLILVGGSQAPAHPS